MSAPRLIIEEGKLIDALKSEGWNKSQVACALGVHRQTVARLMKDYEIEVPALDVFEEEAEVEPEEEDTYTVLDGSVKPDLELQVFETPSLKGDVARYILTSAQNNTMVHEEMWASLNQLARHYDARIMVSRYTYNKGAYKGAQQAKLGTRQTSDTDEMWYDPKLGDYITDHRVRLAPDLEFCGEMNILPTAIRPLSGLDTYTKDRSAIFPHTKLAMVTVPAMKFNRVKFNYTTGTCTMRNYIQRKAGLKAQFHHVYGAMLVEVDSNGDWWARQLMSTEDGTIQDLDVIASPDGVTTDNIIEAIVFGDIHNRALQETEWALSWGPGSLFDTLQPNYQFLHDVLDFRSRAYHDNKRHVYRYAQHLMCTDNVREEVEEVAEFIASAEHPDCYTVVVESNHDAMLGRWLQEADFREDHVNAVFFLECQLKLYNAATLGKPTHLLESLCREKNDLKYTTFLDTDQSYTVHGIECSLHGHRGPDGARGSVANLNRLGVKACPAHTHRATIHDGVWSPGVMGALDQGYNAGPSSWSHSNVLIYQTGKRAMITYRNNKWRASNA